MTATLVQATAAPHSSSGPALEQLGRLTVAYEIFNQELFDGELPPVMLQLRSKPNCYGYFQPNKWKNRDGELIDVIALDSRTAIDRPLEELLSTLVHEMAHAFVFHCTNSRTSSGGHGAKWRAEMERVGLPPIRIGLKWKHATHRIAADGLFHAVFLQHREQLQELPWRECSVNATRGAGRDRTRFQCPSCSGNAWARPSAQLLCGTCSSTEELVEMLPDYKPGTDAPAGKSEKGRRTDYAEPRGAVALPVWTDELGRELRLHTGLDHPPADKADALLVLTFGVEQREPHLAEALISALDSGDEDAIRQALKDVYRHRCRVLHPDMEGGSEVAFKCLQTAHSILRPSQRGKSYDDTEQEEA